MIRKIRQEMRSQHECNIKTQINKSSFFNIERYFVHVSKPNCILLFLLNVDQKMLPSKNILLLCAKILHGQISFGVHFWSNRDIAFFPVQMFLPQGDFGLVSPYLLIGFLFCGFISLYFFGLYLVQLLQNYM